ncbi:hypothetical protein M422DRAFT_47752 [Sphaerobolus stellatus SS14]|uniref:Uncharacterized protein n=1 Tax=Sphaerobolus stellatus (strain SS14) TaxID=990650 RepID=A0A0C9VNP0_SPHS4|nr:hypothetical protein M422DRAFT_47752 [Sphaerobolus stellatus SS14]
MKNIGPLPLEGNLKEESEEEEEAGEDGEGLVAMEEAEDIAVRAGGLNAGHLNYFPVVSPLSIEFRIWKSRLTHELRQMVPKLYCIETLLKPLGPAAVKDDNLEELQAITDSIPTYLVTLASQTALEPPETYESPSIPARRLKTPEATDVPKKKSDEVVIRKRVVVLPPSSERPQKRKQSSSIF